MFKFVFGVWTIKNVQGFDEVKVLKWTQKFFSISTSGVGCPI